MSACKTSDLSTQGSTFHQLSPPPFPQLSLPRSSRAAHPVKICQAAKQIQRTPQGAASRWSSQWWRLLPIAPALSCTTHRQRWLAIVQKPAVNWGFSWSFPVRCQNCLWCLAQGSSCSSCKKRIDPQIREFPQRVSRSKELGQIKCSVGSTCDPNAAKLELTTQIPTADMCKDHDWNGMTE